METRQSTRKSRETTRASAEAIEQAAALQLLPKPTAMRPRKEVPRRSEADEPPRFRINLSLPPEQRYLAVCTALEDEMLGLTSLFDEVVGDQMLPWMPRWLLRFVCRVFLRRVYDDEENAELKGISKATGVDMFLLVCFNVLLDLFMGCSSGGVAVGRENDDEDNSAKRDSDSATKMLLFRTLDWDMPSLRRVVVQLDFVTEAEGPVIASSITYAGFVGVLTGVRKDLGMSLNFRPNRIDNGDFWADAKYTLHLLLVLFGFRPSIVSHLRGFLLPRRRKKTLIQPPTYAEIISQVVGNVENEIRSFSSTACYLCFGNGRETTVVEKDRISAVSRADTDFIAITNSDEMLPQHMQVSDAARENADANSNIMARVVAGAFMEEAKERLECARENWDSMREAKAARARLSYGQDRAPLMRSSDVIEMVQKYPTTNECTHYACVMDPTEGNVVWCRRWKKPITKKWIRDHPSE